jgi:hypothetical protein
MAAVAGAIFGVEALDARTAYNSAPSHATYDHASALQTWTNAAFVASGVLVAGGVALMVWSPGARARGQSGSAAAFSVGPAWAGLVGRFE